MKIMQALTWLGIGISVGLLLSGIIYNVTMGI